MPFPSKGFPELCTGWAVPRAVWNHSILPDDFDELAHVDVIWHQEFGLIQNRKLLLPLVPFNDHLERNKRKQQKM